MKSVFGISVFVSGNGGNLQAIIDAAIDGVKIAPVVSDRLGVRAIERARAANIPVEIVDRARFSSRTQFDAEVEGRLVPYKPDLIVLAGFMRMLSPEFVQKFEGRIINIHPSLLPSFPGIGAIRRALESGAEETGCTVHFVDEGLDTGPVIKNARVSIEPEDTHETLSEKIHALEHKTYPEVIEMLARGKICLEDGRVVFS